MSVAAKLYADDRVAIRRAVSLDATLRDVEQRPVDVEIEDLSGTGFRMSSTAELAIGAIVGVGLAGVGRRDARVVRRTGALYGCEFLVPIGNADIDRALKAETVIVAPDFGPFAPVPMAVPVYDDQKLPVRMRVAIIAGTTVALWGVIIGIALLLF